MIIIKGHVIAGIVLAGITCGMGQTNIYLCLTNNSLLNGELVQITDSNVVVAIEGRHQSFSTNQIRWQEVKIKPPSVQVVAAAATPTSAPTSAPAAAASSPLKSTMSEEELRAQLNSPKGQALLKQVHDNMIGSDRDPRAQKASEYYYKTMQAFAEGKIGLAEIQRQSQDKLDQLSDYQAEMSMDPQQERWEGYRDVLEQFSRQPVQ
jgi:hypothetical protein